MGNGPLEHEGGIQWPMVLSLFVHALGFGLLLMKLSVGERASFEPLLPSAEKAAETWAGTTADLPAGDKLYEVSLNELASGSNSKSPEIAAPSPALQAAPAPPKAAPAPPKPIEKGVDKKEAPPPKEKKAKEPKALKEAPPKPEDEQSGAEDPYEDWARASSGGSKKPEPAASSKAQASQGAEAAPAASAAAGLGGKDTTGGSFGAVGVPGARDMGRAYNQAIPAACAADPVWAELPLGEVGTIRVMLEIGADGRLLSWKALDENAPKALQNMAKRSYAMLQSGIFSLKPGGLSAGRQTLQVSALVGMTDKPLPEGGQIELSQHFEKGEGSSSFVQASGREVKFKVKVLKVEVLEPSSP